MQFTKITYRDDLDKIPARINRDTGELMLNSIVFPQLPNYFQHFLKLHEYGHYLLQTKSENNANAYAIEEFVNYDNNELFSESVIQLIEIFEVIVNNKSKKLTKYYSNNPELIPAENESDFVAATALLISSIIGGATTIGSIIFGAVKSGKNKRDTEEYIEDQRIQGLSNYINTPGEKQDNSNYLYIGLAAIVFVILIIVLIIKKK